MARASRRAPPPASAAVEKRVLRSATAAVPTTAPRRASGEAPTAADRKRASCGKVSSSSDAARAGGNKRRKLSRQEEPAEEEEKKTDGAVLEVQVSSLSLEEEEEEEEKAAEPPVQSTPPADREAGKRKARASFGSDGSSALGGSEGSHSSLFTSQSPSASPRATAPVPAAAQEPDDADCVLHVGGCSFRVNSFRLQQASWEMTRCVDEARRQRVHRAEHGEVAHHSLVGAAAPEPKKDARPMPVTPAFELKRVDGARYLGASISAELALSSAPVRCPLDAASSGAHTGDRAPAATTPFAFVRCAAHADSALSVASGASASGSSSGQRGDVRTSPRDALRGRLPGRASSEPLIDTHAGAAARDGTENRPQNRQDAPRRRQQARDVLAELEGEIERQQREMASQQFGGGVGADAAARPRSPSVPASVATRVPLLHLEWRLADPAAVATVLEFLYTGEVRLVAPSSAFHVVQLCSWMGIQPNALLFACLETAIAHATPAQWVYLFSVSYQQWGVPTRRRALLEQLLAFVRDFPPARSREVLAYMQVEYLAFITDPALLGRVVACFVLHVSHVGVWRNLLFMLDCWGRHRVGRVPTAPVLSLLELHHVFVPWDPFVALPGVEFGGEEHYVTPRTLFRFGDFAFQVRFEMDSLALIQWRVVKAPPQDDDDHDAGTTTATVTPPPDPAFTLRGTMKVRFRCYRAGPTHEQLVALRYTHRAQALGAWQPLVLSSSTTATVVPPLEVRAARAAEGAPSQSETEASQREGGPVEEFLRARFVARVFVWGHRVSSLYHHLAGCSLFCSSPRGNAVGELRPRSTLDKMRRMPVDTLVLTLQSDWLAVSGGETTLVACLTFLCFNVDHTLEYARLTGRAAGRVDYSAVAVVRTLFGCVRWCYADMSQIMRTLERSDRKYELYELIAGGLQDPLLRFPRRPITAAESDAYQEVTTLVEFEIEAGDRSLSPSFFSQDPSSLLTPSSAEM
ncbi:hypothetical protein PybrP1_003951 [[Pythium] brassicae (nom. inval.)]|nr:hypothetical protein PybrP1_003951 [[Pythium] brassicae (nom. inval.)]